MFLVCHVGLKAAFGGQVAPNAALCRQKDRYIKVIVEFRGEEEGTMITAFPTSSPKPGEKLIWPESNP
jgi:hypothetical protein